MQTLMYSSRMDEFLMASKKKNNPRIETTSPYLGVAAEPRIALARFAEAEIVRLNVQFEESAAELVVTVRSQHFLST